MAFKGRKKPRKFGGKEYRFEGIFSFKVDAVRREEKLKEKGMQVRRIKKFPHGWEVWARK